MKNLPLAVSCLSLLFVVMACSASSSETTTETEIPVANLMADGSNTYTVAVEDTIPKSEFIAWTQNWDQHGRSWMDTAKLTAFTLPFVDFSQAQAEDSSVTSRLYLGLEATKTGYIAKLALVGVNDKNQDLLDYAKGQYAYDLSKACPPFCKD